MPKSAIASLFAVQRARDAVLADNLLRALTLEGVDAAVLITDTEHTRTD